MPSPFIESLILWLSKQEVAHHKHDTFPLHPVAVKNHTQYFAGKRQTEGKNLPAYSSLAAAPEKVKIHASRLTPEQKQKLRAAISGKYSLIPHVMQRVNEKSLDARQINETLQTGEPIEFHNESGTRRILLRNAKTGFCIVVDIDTHNIITAYANDVNDTHRTLQRDRYYWGPLTSNILQRFQIT